ANYPPKESPSKVKVAAETLNMRILPDLQQAIVTRLEKGTVLKVIGLENAWLQVETSDGRTGWVAGYLTTDLRTGRPALPLL
ncbi:MAG: SH3 domain-containing protein, partial [Proteobacteria bacterium]|nr:SH3 domain-containing protein [Pseudomonadota bacterium]